MSGFKFLVLLLLAPALSQAWMRKSYNLPGPYIIYKTEPTFIPIQTVVLHHAKNHSRIQPGYIFIAPHVDTMGWGPHIIDEDGELVWYGGLTVSETQGHYSYAMNFHVCDYLGGLGDHLCYSETRENSGAETEGLKAIGANKIFDSSYKQVGCDLQPIGDFPEPNPHEFVILKGGDSYAQSVYNPRAMNLTAYNGNEEGWALEGCIQEASLPDGEELFRWCSLDHQPAWHTDVFLAVEGNKVNKSTHIGGAGRFGYMWDNMHLNAVDKDEEGNYLISARHWDQVIKIAGPNNTWGVTPGEVLWKLGGAYSDFKMHKDAVFGRQHDVRSIKLTATEHWISLFDNAWDGETEPTNNFSSVKVLKLNNNTLKATLDSLFTHPEGVLAYAQGSARYLENGNMFVGWGAIPEWSEFTADGVLLSHGRAITNEKGLENYRALKSRWVGRPKTKPKLLAYCQTCRILGEQQNRRVGEFPLIIYVSWNGATEVRSWRLFTTLRDEHGPWSPAGTWDKEGFETKIKLNSVVLNRLGFTSHVSVEALDADANVLETAYTKTFVPRPRLRHRCDRESCSDPARFQYVQSSNKADSCAISGYRLARATIVLLFSLGLAEIVDYLFQWALSRADATTWHMELPGILDDSDEKDDDSTFALQSTGASASKNVNRPKVCGVLNADGLLSPAADKRPIGEAFYLA